MKRPTNQELLELVEKIQKLPPNSTEYEKALFKLKELISPELLKLCFLKNKDKTNGYDDVRADGLAKTIEKIPEIIKKYDSNKGKTVMGWIKKAYRLELSNLLRAHKKKEDNENSLDKKTEQSGFEPSAKEENKVYGSFNESVDKSPKQLREQIKHCIEQNYDGFFDSIKPISSQNGKSISLQRLLLMRLEDKALTDISAESGISLKTLSSSIKRHMGQLKSYITKHTGIEFDD